MSYSADGVPYFDGSKSFARHWPVIKGYVDEIMEHGKYSHGIMVERLEQRIAAYTGAPHALATANGTDALTLLLRAMGIGPGDEVIVPCFTFFASASSVALVGANPIFVDVVPSSYALDVEAVAAAITPRTRAIMPVHLFTQMADMDALAVVAGKHDLRILEDSAEGIGMTHRGIHAGLLGAGGVLSFFPTKTLGAVGDAGMVLTRDDELAEKIQMMRHHGRCGQTVANLPGISHEALLCGTNSKMDDFQAAVILAHLAALDESIARRARLAALYDAGLAAAAPFVQVPQVLASENVSSAVYYCYVIEAHNKDALAAYLLQRGIVTENYYPRPLHLQPCFAPLGHQPGDFPVAERACQRTLALPLHPDMKDSQVEFVCDALASFYESGEP